jgi:hypothetical protein
MVYLLVPGNRPTASDMNTKPHPTEAPEYRIERRTVFVRGTLIPFRDIYRMLNAATGAEILGWGVPIGTLRRRAKKDGATII